METWGHCSSCDRWFYCATGDAAPDDATWHCPVCGLEPTALEQRACT